MPTSKKKISRKEANKQLLEAFDLFELDLFDYHDVKKAIRQALENGADINTRDGMGRTALFTTAESCGVLFSGKDNPARVLIEAGADINAVDKEGSTPLLHAARIDCRLGPDIYHAGKACKVMFRTKFFINNGGDIYCNAENGITFLHRAVIMNDEKAVKDLLAAGADPNAADGKKPTSPRSVHMKRGGLTPLHYAACFGNVKIARMLLDAGADVNAHERVEFLSPLMIAAHHSPKIVDLLLKNGAVAYERSKYGWTALHAATRTGNTIIASMLLNNGADVNVKSKSRHTPLHVAAECGNINTAKLLLESGADIHAVDEEGLTPILTAQWWCNDPEASGDMVRLLLDYGANVKDRDIHGNTPMHDFVQGDGIDLDILRPAAPPQIGDVVRFGNYAGESIAWLVLDRQPDRVLLISQYGLDCRQYHEAYEAITWEKCTLRKWLNSEFTHEAFTAHERERIALVNIPAQENPCYPTDPGRDTQDKLFLLSLKEAEQYFSSDSARRCRPTSYAIEKGILIDDYGYCDWLLRSPGYLEDDAAFVFSCGTLKFLGDEVDCVGAAVRPALWLNLES